MATQAQFTTVSRGPNGKVERAVTNDMTLLRACSYHGEGSSDYFTDDINGLADALRYAEIAQVPA